MTEALVPRDAATVMLVRDGRDGLEVLMLRRALDAVFVGGAYVFPGGAVDPDDRHDDLDAVCRGRSDAEASALLHLDGPGGLAFWVAAIRECFEEAGVLLAYGRDGDIVHLDAAEVAERFAVHRAAVDRGDRRLVEVCVEEGLRLAVDRIHYFSHWITPEGPPRRYDTRFFVAAAPANQTPLHDERETIETRWITSEAALARHAAGELDLILPTIKNLEAIGRFSTADELLAAAEEAAGDVPAVLPRIVDDGGGMRILLPGDPGYDDAGTSAGIPGGAPMPGRPGGPALGSRR